MSPESLIEAFARGVVSALLAQATPTKPVRRKRRTQAVAASSSAPPTLFDSPPVQPFDPNAVPPATSAELDALLKQFDSNEIERALTGADAPGTYRPGEGTWIGDS